jgi:uncharacterized membrane protein
MMEVSGEFFSDGLIGAFGVLYLLSLYYALRIALRARSLHGERLHVFLGAVVCLVLLWHMRAEVTPGLSFHLLGVTAVTLMFGWALGVIGSTLALLGVAINAGSGWDAFVVNAVITGVLPVTLTQVLLVLIRHYLPRQFFVYVLANGFLTAGLASVVPAGLVAWMLVGSGAYSLDHLSHTFLPFFPLMFLPEAMLNGWIVAALVAFRPGWVGSFSDEVYIRGK